MELRGKVAIITRGTTNVGFALASCLSKLGAIVIVADTETRHLFYRAQKIKATALVADIKKREQIRNLIDHVIRQFGKIDIFISLPTHEVLNYALLFEKDCQRILQEDLLTQMYVAKYLLPHMIDQKCGYILSMVPAAGLFDEFKSESFSTLTNPCFCLASRMMNVYKKLGIKISVICSDIPVLNTAENISEDLIKKSGLENFAKHVVYGIKDEAFIINHSGSKSAPSPMQFVKKDVYGRLRA